MVGSGGGRGVSVLAVGSLYSCVSCIYVLGDGSGTSLCSAIARTCKGEGCCRRGGLQAAGGGGAGWMRFLRPSFRPHPPRGSPHALFRRTMAGYLPPRGLRRLGFAP